MPNRILYEKVCVSASLAQLGAEEERFFYRLLVVCDDFGRFDARPAVLRGRCFPLMLDRVGEADVAGWLTGLQVAGLLVVYAVDGLPFLQVHTFGSYQRLRAKRSKFPGPPTLTANGPLSSASADIGVHPRALDSNGGHPPPSAGSARARADSYSYSYSETETETETEARNAAPRRRDVARARASGAAAPTIPTTDDDERSHLADAMDPATVDAARAVWLPVSERLRGEMHARNWGLYIKPVVPLGIAADGALLLSTANPLVLEQAPRFRQQMLRALADIPDVDPQGHPWPWGPHPPRDVRLVAQ